MLNLARVLSFGCELAMEVHHNEAIEDVNYNSPQQAPKFDSYYVHLSHGLL